MVDAADTIVWLDLPLRVWLPRLLKRTRRRIRGEERIFNDNRESWKTGFAGREALFPYALATRFRRRSAWPAQYAGRNVIRLRTPQERRAMAELDDEQGGMSQLISRGQMRLAELQA